MKKKTKYIIGGAALLTVIVLAMFLGNKPSQKDEIAHRLANVNKKISEISRRATNPSNADELINLTIQKNALMSKYSSL